MYTDYNELYHHGVLGQKWGVRRFQNKDGSLTNAGKKRAAENREKMSPERKKEIAKKVAVGAAVIGTAAVAAVYVKNHPEVIVKVASKAKNINVKDLSSKAINTGKNYVKDYAKNAAKGVKEGVKEAMREAPKKAAKAVVTGVVMNATKRALDQAVGKEEATRIFKANNPKKIDSFWRVQREDDD